MFTTGQITFMYNMYVFTKKNYISIYIDPISGIHNTSLTNAYFRLDKRLEILPLKKVVLAISRLFKIKKSQEIARTTVYVTMKEDYNFIRLHGTLRKNGAHSRIF
jgi:hypothetical protein